MNNVPFRYRNVINPWMDYKEIKKAIAFIDRMTMGLKLSSKETLELLRTNLPDKDWSKPY